MGAASGQPSLTVLLSVLEHSPWPDEFARSPVVAAASNTTLTVVIASPLIIFELRTTDKALPILSDDTSLAQMPIRVPLVPAVRRARSRTLQPAGCPASDDVAGPCEAKRVCVGWDESIGAWSDSCSISNDATDVFFLEAGSGTADNEYVMCMCDPKVSIQVLVLELWSEMPSPPPAAPPPPSLPPSPPPSPPPLPQYTWVAMLAALLVDAALVTQLSLLRPQESRLSRHYRYLIYWRQRSTLLHQRATGPTVLDHLQDALVGLCRLPARLLWVARLCGARTVRVARHLSAALAALGVILTAMHPRQLARRYRERRRAKRGAVARSVEPTAGENDGFDGLDSPTVLAAPRKLVVRQDEDNDCLSWLLARFCGAEDDEAAVQRRRKREARRQRRGVRACCRFLARFTRSACLALARTCLCIQGGSSVDGTARPSASLPWQLVCSAHPVLRLALRYELSPARPPSRSRTSQAQRLVVAGCALLAQLGVIALLGCRDGQGTEAQGLWGDGAMFDGGTPYFDWMGLLPFGEWDDSSSLLIAVRRGGAASLASLVVALLLETLFLAAQAASRRHRLRHAYASEMDVLTLAGLQHALHVSQAAAAVRAWRDAAIELAMAHWRDVLVARRLRDRAVWHRLESKTRLVETSPPPQREGKAPFQQALGARRTGARLSTFLTNDEIGSIGALRSSSRGRWRDSSARYRPSDTDEAAPAEKAPDVQPRKALLVPALDMACVRLPVPAGAKLPRSPLAHSSTASSSRDSGSQGNGSSVMSSPTREKLALRKDAEAQAVTAQQDTSRAEAERKAAVDEAADAREAAFQQGTVARAAKAHAEATAAKHAEAAALAVIKSKAEAAASKRVERAVSVAATKAQAATAAQAKADAPGAKDAAKRAVSSAREQANKAQAEALAAREAAARTSHEAMEAVRQAKAEKLSAQKAAEVEAAETATFAEAKAKATAATAVEEEKVAAAEKTAATATAKAKVATVAQFSSAAAGKLRQRTTGGPNEPPSRASGASSTDADDEADADAGGGPGAGKQGWRKLQLVHGAIARFGQLREEDASFVAEWTKPLAGGDANAQPAPAAVVLAKKEESWLRQGMGSDEDAELLAKFFVRTAAPSAATAPQPSPPPSPPSPPAATTVTVRMPHPESLRRQVSELSASKRDLAELTSSGLTLRQKVAVLVEELNLGAREDGTSSKPTLVDAIRLAQQSMGLTDEDAPHGTVLEKVNGLLVELQRRRKAEAAAAAAAVKAAAAEAKAAEAAALAEAAKAEAAARQAAEAKAKANEEEEAAAAEAAAQEAAAAEAAAAEAAKATAAEAKVAWQESEKAEEVVPADAKAEVFSDSEEEKSGVPQPKAEVPTTEAPAEAVAAVPVAAPPPADAPTRRPSSRPSSVRAPSALPRSLTSPARPPRSPSVACVQTRLPHPLRSPSMACLQRSIEAAPLSPVASTASSSEALSPAVVSNPSPTLVRTISLSPRDLTFQRELHETTVNIDLLAETTDASAGPVMPATPPRRRSRPSKISQFEQGDALIPFKPQRPPDETPPSKPPAMPTVKSARLVHAHNLDAARMRTRAAAAARREVDQSRLDALSRRHWRSSAPWRNTPLFELPFAELDSALRCFVLWRSLAADPTWPQGLRQHQAKQLDHRLLAGGGRVEATGTGLDARHAWRTAVMASTVVVLPWGGEIAKDGALRAVVRSTGQRWCRSMETLSRIGVAALHALAWCAALAVAVGAHAACLWFWRSCGALSCAEDWGVAVAAAFAQALLLCSLASGVLGVVRHTRVC